MKRFLNIILIFAFLCLFAITVNAASPAVSVSPSKSAVNQGDTITISVKLSANSNLGAIDLTVKYNTSEFQYVSGSASAGGLFSMENIVDSKVGSVRYLGVSDGVVNGAGNLVKFKLKVLKYGGKISVSAGEAIDGDDKDITSIVKVTGTTLKCAHGNAVWKVTKNATCTEKGVETGTCPCGNVSTREIAKTEHTVGKYIVTKEATCTEKGVKKAACIVCNKEYTEEIQATGHTYGKWVIVNEATETEKGLKKTECTVCGDVKEQIIPVIIAETESSTENTTEATTFNEETTDEPSTEENITKEPVENEKKQPSIAKTIVLTVFTTLGVEAIIAGLIILILKQRKKEKKE